MPNRYAVKLSKGKLVGQATLHQDCPNAKELNSARFLGIVINNEAIENKTLPAIPYLVYVIDNYEYADSSKGPFYFAVDLEKTKDVPFIIKEIRNLPMYGEKEGTPPLMEDLFIPPEKIEIHYTSEDLQNLKRFSADKITYESRNFFAKLIKHLPEFNHLENYAKKLAQDNLGKEKSETMDKFINKIKSPEANILSLIEFFELLEDMKHITKNNDHTGNILLDDLVSPRLKWGTGFFGSKLNASNPMSTDCYKLLDKLKTAIMQTRCLEALNYYPIPIHFTYFYSKDNLLKLENPEVAHTHGFS